jgi:hypothetical protein
LLGLEHREFVKRLLEIIEKGLPLRLFGSETAIFCGKLRGSYYYPQTYHLEGETVTFQLPSAVSTVPSRWYLLTASASSILVASAKKARLKQVVWSPGFSMAAAPFGVVLLLKFNLSDARLRGRTHGVHCKQLDIDGVLNKCTLPVPL